MLSGLRARLLSPLALTTALTAATAVSGGALLTLLPQQPLLGTPAGVPAVAVLVVLGVTFVLAELGQVLVEIRRQAYSICLTGVPLLLGLLYCPPQHLLAVRLLAAVATFALQRSPLLKSAFNTSVYLLDTVLVVLLCHLLVGAAPGLSLRTAAGAFAALTVVELLMSALVLLVIRIHHGPLGRSTVLDVLVPVAAVGLVSTTAGFIAAGLLGLGSLGVALLAVFALLVAATYRGYLLLRARHHSLELVQEFVELTSGGAGDGEEFSGRLLDHLRTVLRASRVEFTSALPDGCAGAVRVAVDEHGAVSVVRGDEDAFLLGCAERGAAVVLNSSSPDQAARRWLSANGIGDALVVPLPLDGARGVVVALDRLGDSTAFTAHDLAMLQTLTGHLAVAVRNAQLVGRLRHEATHDRLTGLANRLLLGERMQAALDGDPHGRIAVLLLDLDRFEEVNEALGHLVGDELLQVVAGRLEGLDLRGGTVARLSGDEFAVLLPASPCAEADSLAVVAELEHALAAPVELSGVVLSTSASIGVALSSAGHTADDLLRQADTAMHAAKRDGTGVRAYSADLDEGQVERLVLLPDLRRALERDELDVFYQPKLDLAQGAVTSAEALVRWNHPTLGRLAPDVFIGLAESTGLIERLTHNVLAKALRQCREWQDAGLELSVAVNLSARNVGNPALPARVAAALAEAGVPAHRLTLEITESSVMRDPERALPVLRELEALGVALSLDDFGTGYSSLSYLQRLPVCEVKVDRSFVMGLEVADEARTSAALIRSITGLGASLGLRIVAEGVESAEVLEELRELGCDVIQGYHVGRPLPSAEFDAAVRVLNGVAQEAGAAAPV